MWQSRTAALRLADLSRYASQDLFVALPDLYSVQGAVFLVEIFHFRCMRQRFAGDQLDEFLGRVTLTMRMDILIEPLLQFAEFAFGEVLIHIR